MSQAIIPIEEAKARFEAMQTSLEALQTELQEKLVSGPVAAQTARLVAFALAKQAYSILENVGGSLQYMTPRQPGEEGENPLAALIDVAEEVVSAMMAQFGVTKEAITPFLGQTNSIMIPLAEDLLAKAKAKLAEAESLSA